MGMVLSLLHLKMCLAHIALEFSLLDKFYNFVMEVATVFYVMCPLSVTLTISPVGWIVSRRFGQGQEILALDLIKNCLAGGHE